MQSRTSPQGSTLVSLLLVFAGLVQATSLAAGEEGPQQANFKAQFLKLCDESCPILRQQARATEKRSRVFYTDSYAVRALMVAYDMTGKQEYFDASTLWCDGMLEYQQGMIPAGAYYMQYGRKPGEDKGNRYSADSSSIGLGVLSVSVRSTDPKQKQRYLDSVKAFFKLVADRFVRPSGGVTDGYWPKSDDEWWCSTGIFGSLAFHLYAETRDESYLQIGLGTIDWLNRQDLLGMKDYAMPIVLMYSLEAYSASKDFPGLLDDIRAKLMWGTVYHYYAVPKQPYGAITQHMSPFTPVELHHGWLLGKERIIKAVPGTFSRSTLAHDMPPLNGVRPRGTRVHGPERYRNFMLESHLCALPIAVDGVHRGQRSQQQGSGEGYESTSCSSVHRGDSLSHVDGQPCGSWHLADSPVPHCSDAERRVKTRSESGSQRWPLWGDFSGQALFREKVWLLGALTAVSSMGPLMRRPSKGLRLRDNSEGKTNFSRVRVIPWRLQPSCDVRVPAARPITTQHGGWVGAYRGVSRGVRFAYAGRLLFMVGSVLFPESHGAAPPKQLAAVFAVELSQFLARRRNHPLLEIWKGRSGRRPEPVAVRSSSVARNAWQNPLSRPCPSEFPGVRHSEEVLSSRHPPIEPCLLPGHQLFCHTIMRKSRASRDLEASSPTGPKSVNPFPRVLED